MSVGRTTSSKPLAFITSLMVLFALVVPFAGTALATHDDPSDQNPAVISLDPPSDSAPTGTCNTFTVTATAGGEVAENETIDIRATQSDADTLRDLRIAFCDPDASGAGTDLTGAQGAGGGPEAPAADCDDNGTTNFNDGGTCPGTAPAPTTESPADIRDECFTNANGQCTFGVTSNEAGTMTVEAFFDTDGDNVRDSNEPFDQSTKTWGAGGQEAVENISCTPATDSNPIDTRHEFQCTVTDAGGNALAGVDVFFDVTAGPNAEEIGPTSCGTATNNSGQTQAPDNDQVAEGECGYQDAPTGASGATAANSSPPGTDTITAYVNQAAQPGQPATQGADPGEPRTTIQKTWVGAANSIQCTPDSAEATTGTVQSVTCTVTDVAGAGVPNVEVDFSETGPGRIITPNATTGIVTNNAGQAQVEVQTAENEEGVQTITGTIDNTPDSGTATSPTNCTGANNTPPNPNTANTVCSDTASYTWSVEGPAQNQCEDGIDNDDDGAIDFPADRDCDSPSDASEADEGGRFATNLTIRRDASAARPNFKGKAGSARRECKQGRVVVLKKVRPGPNRTVGRDRTNRRGNWRINKRRARGRYYAVVRRQTKTAESGALLVCNRDRSVTIHVRR